MNTRKDKVNYYISKIRNNKILSKLIVIGIIIISIGTLVDSLRNNYVKPYVEIVDYLKKDTNVDKNCNIKIFENEKRNNIRLSVDFITDNGEMYFSGKASLKKIFNKYCCGGRFIIEMKDEIRKKIFENDIYISNSNGIYMALQITNLTQKTIYIKDLNLIAVAGHKSDTLNNIDLFSMYTGGAEVSYNAFNVNNINHKKRKYKVFLYPYSVDSNKDEFSLDDISPNDQNDQYSVRTKQEVKLLRKGLFEISPEKSDFFIVGLSLDKKEGVPFKCYFELIYSILGEEKTYISKDKFNI